MPITSSGVYLVFVVFQDNWRSNKENRSVSWNAALSCPSMASNYADSYLFSRICDRILSKLNGIWFTAARPTPWLTQPGETNICKRDWPNTLIGNENWTQTFFSQTFRAPPGYPGKIPGYPAQKFDFPGFEGHTELFGPHPFVWKTPTPPENIRAQKFRFGFVFRAWVEMDNNTSRQFKRGASRLLRARQRTKRDVTDYSKAVLGQRLLCSQWCPWKGK